MHSVSFSEDAARLSFFFFFGGYFTGFIRSPQMLRPRLRSSGVGAAGWGLGRFVHLLIHPPKRANWKWTKSDDGRVGNTISVDPRSRLISSFTGITFFFFALFVDGGAERRSKSKKERKRTAWSESRWINRHSRPRGSLPKHMKLPVFAWYYSWAASRHDKLITSPHAGRITSKIKGGTAAQLKIKLKIRTHWYQIVPEY